MLAEQEHIDTVHDRVEELRDTAMAHAARAEADQSGSTFQAIYERDVTAYHHARRASRFTFGDEEALVFGRLDDVNGQVFHIGRVSVTDEDRDILLVDWRAPAAADFYQATPASPHGVARRRTLTCRGRRLVDLDDEIVDAEAAQRLGLEAVTGQGALLAALTRTRTGRMRDIVATIQADQDRIIRKPATGTLIVAGGPGTGKTVVALHRVAYLLYTNRDRYDRRGVLVVGPTTVFTRYIGNVLPSLGEERASLRSLERFVPELGASGWDNPEVAAIKGRIGMTEICRRLVGAALPTPERALRLAFEGIEVDLAPQELAALRDDIWRRTRSADVDGFGGYHARRGALQDAIVDRAWKHWQRAREQSPRAVPDERTGSGFDHSVRGDHRLLSTVRQLWPELDAADLVRGLVSGNPSIHDIAGGTLSPQETELLADAWAKRADLGPTIDDVALADEVSHLLGPRTSGREAEEEAGIRLSIEDEDVWVDLPDVNDPTYRDFAHVVVDEAQDLTPMQWRMIARHAPRASWTVVGDLAQRSRIAEPESWQDIATLIGRRQVEIERLTVNYRTPSEVMELARAALGAAGLNPDAAPEAVRSTGRRPRVVRTDRVLPSAIDAAVAAGRRRDGVIAVVVLDDEVAPAGARLEDALQTLTERERVDLTERIRIHDPRSVKGLEFDAVVVAAPDRLAAASSVGAHQLYVVFTRTTDELVLVAEPGAHFPGADHAQDVPSADGSGEAADTHGHHH